LIFLDTNVISETLRPKPHEAVEAWLKRFDAELALSTIVIAEVAHGIRRIHPDQRARRWEENLLNWRQRLSGHIFPFTEDAALAYGEIMGDASRRGRTMSVPDGMIAAIARVHGGRLATRNIPHFEGCGLSLIDPWTV
jgi:predicted nucleic acid-binding protein